MDKSPSHLMLTNNKDKYMLSVQSIGAVYRWIRLNLETGPQVCTYAVQCELLSEYIIHL